MNDSDKGFADTNILIYTYDPTEAEKHRRAQQLLQRLLKENRLVISAQVLNEFYWVATRPSRSAGFSHERTVGIIRHLVQGCDVVPLTFSTTIRALDALQRYGLSFWDALIWSAAKESNANVIYIEDFQHGRVAEGIEFVNPFH